MATFFKSSKVWVIDFTYEGRPRKWFKALPEGSDARREMEALVQDLYGKRGQVVEVRPATAQEETDYIQGNLPKNMLCPTGRSPVTQPRR